MNQKYTIAFTAIVLIAGISCEFAQRSMSKTQTETPVGQTRSDNTCPYKIIKITCTQTGSCYVMTVLESKVFNKADLIPILKSLSKIFDSQKGVTVWLFDDEQLAESFATGKREYINISSDARGKYVRGGEEEFLIFSPNQSKLGDLSNVVTVNLRQSP